MHCFNLNYMYFFILEFEAVLCPADGNQATTYVIYEGEHMVEIYSISDGED